MVPDLGVRGGELPSIGKERLHPRVAGALEEGNLEAASRKGIGRRGARDAAAALQSSLKAGTLRALQPQHFRGVLRLPARGLPARDTLTEPAHK